MEGVCCDINVEQVVKCGVHYLLVYAVHVIPLLLLHTLVNLDLRVLTSSTILGEYSIISTSTQIPRASVNTHHPPPFQCNIIRPIHLSISTKEPQSPPHHIVLEHSTKYPPPITSTVLEGKFPTGRVGMSGQSVWIPTQAKKKKENPPGETKGYNNLQPPI